MLRCEFHRSFVNQKHHLQTKGFWTHKDGQMKNQLRMSTNPWVVWLEASIEVGINILGEVIPQFFSSIKSESWVVILWTSLSTNEFGGTLGYTATPPIPMVDHHVFSFHNHMISRPISVLYWSQLNPNFSLNWVKPHVVHIPCQLKLPWPVDKSQARGEATVSVPLFPSLSRLNPPFFRFVSQRKTTGNSPFSPFFEISPNFRLWFPWPCEITGSAACPVVDLRIRRWGWLRNQGRRTRRQLLRCAACSKRRPETTWLAIGFHHFCWIPKWCGGFTHPVGNGHPPILLVTGGWFMKLSFIHTAKVGNWHFFWVESCFVVIREDSHDTIDWCTSPRKNIIYWQNLTQTWSVFLRDDMRPSASNSTPVHMSKSRK